MCFHPLDKLLSGMKKYFTYILFLLFLTMNNDKCLHFIQKINYCGVWNLFSNSTFMDKHLSIFIKIVDKNQHFIIRKLDLIY